MLHLPSDFRLTDLVLNRKVCRCNRVRQISYSSQSKVFEELLSAAAKCESSDLFLYFC